MANLLKPRRKGAGASSTSANFSFKEKWGMMPPAKKAVVGTLLAVLVLLIFFGVWGLVNIRTAKTVYAESLLAKDSLTYAQVAVGNQDFERAIGDLEEAKGHFENAQSGWNRFTIYKIIPGARTQVKAIDNVLGAGLNLTNGLLTFAEIGQDINETIAAKEGDVSFGDLSADDKRAILQTLSESPVELQSVKSDMETAVLLIEEIPEDGLLSSVSAAVEPVKQQLPILQGLVTQAIPLAQSLPAIAGYPSEKTYLFLLQNNHELRPTGGFIGTYGILKMEDGDINNFFTDNIYNLDDQAKDYITEPSPGPIAQHTSTQNWLMRNSNWSPDFPTSARKAESKYHEEGGPEQDVDGVIAVTPTFIESLLDLTGPITVDGVEFSSENLVSILEYQVGVGFAIEGITEENRKDIIGKLASALIDEIFALPRSEFASIWETFVDNVDQKQILIYLDDEITQELVIEQNWAGEMKPYAGDYVFFVDANLAALKTDDVMERTLNHSISEQDGDYQVTTSMEYKHTGNFDAFTTRYRTYTRIYLPQGVEVVSTDGFLTGDKTQGGVATDPDIWEESFTHADGTEVTYTVVGGFIAIEPQTTGNLSVTYKANDAMKKQIRGGEYTLYAQKQPGTIAHDLHVNFDIGKQANPVSQLDGTEKIGENQVQFTTSLLTDRELEVSIP